MTDAEIDAVWERIQAARQATLDESERNYRSVLQSARAGITAGKAELAAVLREREPSEEAMTIASRLVGDWEGRIKRMAFVPEEPDRVKLAREFLRLAPPPGPG